MTGRWKFIRKYYNQKDVIEEIHNDTGCSIRNVTNVLTSLRNVVKDKLGDLDAEVEVKLFPGLSVTSKRIPLEQTKHKSVNENVADSTYLLSVRGKISDRFKREIKNKN